MVNRVRHVRQLHGGLTLPIGPLLLAAVAANPMRRQQLVLAECIATFEAPYQNAHAHRAVDAY